jgi:hypothetical protein
MLCCQRPFGVKDSLKLCPESELSDRFPPRAMFVVFVSLPLFYGSFSGLPSILATCPIFVSTSPGLDSRCPDYKSGFRCRPNVRNARAVPLVEWGGPFSLI